MDNKEQRYDYLHAETYELFALEQLKKYQQANERAEKLIEQVINNYGRENGLYIQLTTLRAVLLVRFKQYNKSLTLYEENIEIKKKLKINYATDENQIENIYFHRLHNYPVALQHFSEAIRLHKIHVSNVTGSLGYYTRNLGLAYYYIDKNIDLAMLNMKKAKEIFESIPDDFSIPLKKINEWIVYLEEKILEKT